LRLGRLLGVPHLSAALWRVQLGTLVNALGNGIVFPFLLIYLHDVRGIGLGAAGLIIALNSLSAVAVMPSAGALIDRIGARSVLALSMIVSAVGYAGLAFAHGSLIAGATCVVAGAGNGAFMPATSALTSALTTTPIERTEAFSTLRVVINLGLGLGAAIGGLLATTSSPRSYVLLFLIDAATFGAYLMVLIFIPDPDLDPGPGRGERGQTRGGGYGVVMKNRLFLRMLALEFILIGAGFAWLQDIIPAFAKDDLHIGEKAIGVIFLANTATIVIGQFPITRLLGGRRRMIGYALEALVWAVSWLVVVLATKSSGSGAIALVALAVTFFAIGECFHGGIRNSLVADLAEPALIGRYMAALGFAFQLGYAGGRAVGGIALASAPRLMWVIAAGVMIACGLYAVDLDRRLPEAIRRIPRRERVAPSQAPEATALSVE